MSHPPPSTLSILAQQVNRRAAQFSELAAALKVQMQQLAVERAAIAAERAELLRLREAEEQRNAEAAADVGVDVDTFMFPNP